MNRQSRLTGLVLLGVLGWLLGRDLAAAGLYAPPIRRVQHIQGTVEPPLADAPPAQAPRSASPQVVVPRHTAPPPPPESPPPPIFPARPQPRNGRPAPAAAPNCPKDPPVPVVALRMRVAACVDAGQEIEYRICVENTAHAPAHRVTVRNPLPANARFVRAEPPPVQTEPELVWKLGTLGDCQCKEIILVLAPTSGGEVRNCACVQFEHGQCVCTKVNAPALSLRKSGPGQALLYDRITYKLEVKNTGQAPLTDVVLTDALPEGLQDDSGKTQLSWDIGTLAPGQTRTEEYVVTAMAEGQYTNHAEARAAGGLLERAQCCLTVTGPKLTLKKVGPAQQAATQPAVYQITACNPGTAPVTNLVITDVLPPQATFVSASAGGKLDGNTVRWTLGTLPPGGSQTVELVLRAQAAGQVCNKATASADRGLTAESEACTEFVGAAALLLEVIDDDFDPLEINTEGRYLIRVRNTGHLATTNVRIVATLPKQMRFTAAAPTEQFTQDGAIITFAPIGLEPQGEAVFEVRGRAIEEGDVRFRVDLTADQLENPGVREDESTTIYADHAPALLKKPEAVSPAPPPEMKMDIKPLPPQPVTPPAPPITPPMPQPLEPPANSASPPVMVPLTPPVTIVPTPTPAKEPESPPPPVPEIESPE